MFNNMWTYLLAVSLVFGYEFSTLFVSCYLDLMQRIFCGSIFGMISQSWVFYILSYFVDNGRKCYYLVLTIYCVSTLILHYVNSRKPNIYCFFFNNVQLLTYLVFCGFMIYIFSSTSFYKNLYTKGAGFSDLPFHLNIISSFTVGFNQKRKSLFSVYSSFFYNESLVYPFITNYYSSSLMKYGETDFRSSILYPSLVASFSLVIGIYSLTFYYCRSHIASFLSLFMFTSLGGTGFLSILREDCDSNYQRDYVHDWCHDQREFWFHSIVHYIMPQRGSLWSLPICIWSILLLFIGNKYKDKKVMFFSGVMVSILPMIQLHSYVAMAQFSIFFCLITFSFKKMFMEHFWIWFSFGLPALMFGIPQVIPFLHRVNRNFAAIDPIWKENNWSQCTFPFFVMWWRSLGVFFVISLFLGWIYASKEQILMYLPSLFVFIIANIVRYQPWVHDNTKVFYSGWIPVALPFVSNYLTKFIRNNLKGIQATISMIYFGLLVLFITLSGVLTTISICKYSSPLYNDGGYEFGLWVAENTPVQSVFHFDAIPSNPPSNIGGRQLFCGFGGWVYSHGLDFSRVSYGEKLSKNHHIKNLFLENNITYLGCINDSSQKCPRTREDIWSTVYSDSIHTLYKIVL